MKRSNRDYGTGRRRGGQPERAVRRRTVLSTLAGIGGVTLAGCISSTSRETKLASVGITNLDDQPHRLDVRIWRNEELRFDDGFHLKRKSDFGTSANPAPVIEDPWMRDPGTFRLSVRLDDEQQAEEQIFPDEERPGDCYRVSITVREPGIVTLPFDESSSFCS